MIEAQRAAITVPNSTAARLEAAMVSINRWILIILMAVMAVLVFANVVSRYVLRKAAEEAVRVLQGTPPRHWLNRS